MNELQWTELVKSIKQENDALSIGLIVDSPWMPGYCGINNIDFYVRPDEWVRSYRKIKADFPEVLFIPDWWNEFGMATEPSGFGCKFNFYEDNLPTLNHIIDDIEDLAAIKALKVPDPHKDGLMPLLLNLQRYAQPYMKEMGEDHYIVATRGPLTIASHLLELTELLVAIKTEPDSAHALLRKTTDLCKLWLEAQLDNVKTAKGILVLDDPTGFLEEDDYLEFSHPYIKEIFSAFPEAIHIFHNDAVRTASYPHLEDMGVDLFNFTHTVDIGEAKKLLGPNVCMLGNVPPMALAKQSPEEVYTLTQDCISRYIEANNGSFRGLIVSPGGGMPMGATHENTRALIKAVKTFGL